MELSGYTREPSTSLSISAGNGYSLGYSIYTLLGLLLVASACLILGPSIGALLYSANAFGSVVIPVIGQVLLFTFLGVALYRMYSIDRAAR